MLPKIHVAPLVANMMIHLLMNNRVSMRVFDRGPQILNDISCQ